MDWTTERYVVFLVFEDETTQTRLENPQESFILASTKYNTL